MTANNINVSPVQRNPMPSGWTGTIVGCLSAAVIVAYGTGCPAGEPGADTGADTTGLPQSLDGNQIRCCYSGSFSDTGQEFFCLSGFPPCMDQALGTDTQDLLDFCNQKCLPSWDVNTVLPYGVSYFDVSGNQIITAPGYLNSCNAINTEDLSTHVVSIGSCNPSDPVSFGEFSEAPPQFGGFFSDRDGTMDIEVVGAELTAEYELELHFALVDCLSGGIDGGTCNLVVTGFEMFLHDVATSGMSFSYDVEANLNLSRSVVAEVVFDECSLTSCDGEFSFGPLQGNPLELDVLWDQVNVVNSAVGGGAIHIGNDGNSLGGVDIFYGSIHLDPGGEWGTISMSGSGEDSFGGDFASAEFSLFGFVETIDPAPGDCCDEDLISGGCSNKYITACVAARDPSCYSSAWDADCVLAVNALECGFCE